VKGSTYFSTTQLFVDPKRSLWCHMPSIRFAGRSRRSDAARARRGAVLAEVLYGTGLKQPIRVARCMRIRSLLRSNSEARTDRVLRRALEKRGYRVCPSVRVSDVIDYEYGEATEVERDLLRKMHFDFVVTLGDPPLPQFVVEFDGPQHFDDDAQARLDAVKNRFCRDASLDLLRISSQELQPREQVSLLDWVLERWVAWREEYPGSLQEDWEDPTVVFDARHPYPAVLTMSARLLRLGVITLYARDRDIARLTTRNMRSVLVRCEKVGSAFVPEDEWQTVEHRLAVLPWARQSLQTPIYETAARARVRWALPAGWNAREQLRIADGNQDDLEAAITRAQNLAWSELPGTSGVALAEGLAEYLALRDVENWALQRQIAAT